MPSTVDIQTPFDFTALTGFTAAQLQQWGGGITPYADKGLIMSSFDVNGTPAVPNATNATGTPKWQNYVWLRVTASAAIVYVWNPAAASDPVFLQWQTIAASSIGIGTITGGVGGNIQQGTITGYNINASAGIPYAAIAGTPTALPPNGAAGGSLTGTYPNPTIAANAITNAMIGNNSAAGVVSGGVTSGGNVDNIVPKSISFPIDCAPSLSAYALPRTNNNFTAIEWVTPLAAAVYGASSADVGKVPVVANPYTAGVSLVASTAVGRILQIVQATLSTQTANVGHLANYTSTPVANDVGMTQLMSRAVTPLSATSKIRIQFTGMVSVAATAAVYVGIYTGTGNVNSIGGTGYYTTGNAQAPNLSIDLMVANPGGATTYYVIFGTTANTATFNSLDAANAFGTTGVQSSLTLTEYL